MAFRWLTRMLLGAGTALLAAVACSAPSAQTDALPINDRPNPYRTILNWAQLPDGRKWGAMATVDIDVDGRSLWIAERCGSGLDRSGTAGVASLGSCAGSTIPPIVKLDPSGKPLKTFGAGMFVLPHGIFVDRDGNVWFTDAQGVAGKGHQVFKFSPEGKVLMTLGKAGIAGDGPDTFNQPTDVLVAPDGSIFVSDGHGATGNARIVKFSKDGTFIKTWGKKGSAPGELNTPHAITLDSRGRLFVADRGNNRIQIFDQDGKYLDQWKQFGRPSGIVIMPDDTIYVSDSESDETRNPGWKKGIRIGSAKDGSVRFFIEDSESTKQSPAGPEGLAVDRQDNVFGAIADRQTLEKHLKK